MDHSQSLGAANTARSVLRTGLPASLMRFPATDAAITGVADYEESAPCTFALSTTCSNCTSLSLEKVKM